MKCPNCGKTEFVPMDIVSILATEGRQIVDSFVCLNCGRVELFMPKELVDKRIEQIRVAEERKQAEEKRKIEREKLTKRMNNLLSFLDDENHTLKELKEAQLKLNEIQRELGLSETRRF